MTDTSLEVLDWFSGPPETSHATRAERIEYLATVAPRPVRSMANLLLAVDARSAPWRQRMHRSSRQLGAGTVEAGATAGRTAGRTARGALVVATRAGRAAARVGGVSDRMAQAVAAHLDRLASADARFAERIERRLTFLHPLNLLRFIQTALMVVGGLAVMAAISFTPNGRSTRVAVLATTGASAPPSDHLLAQAEGAVTARHHPDASATPKPTTGHPRPANAKPAAGHLRPAKAAPQQDTAVAAPDRPPPVAPPTPAPAPVAAAAARRGALPVGKGMWIYQPQATEGANAGQIVARAKAAGLTHVYVRTGSSIDGFNTAAFLDQLLPVAHAGGIRVIGWDYPYLHNVSDDIARATAVMRHTTPGGERLDGFAADVEPWDGAHLTPATAAAYSTALRQAAGAGYPLVACVPRPNPALTNYPFAQLLPSFDAVAPMIYWMDADPAAATRMAFVGLAPYGKPVIPIGQAYDASADGGPRGVPSPAQIQEFIAAADASGAIGVSFWSWQAAPQPAWNAIQAAPQFGLGATDPSSLTASQIRSYQAALASLGYPVNLSGALDRSTSAALGDYQDAAHAPRTGTLDELTQSLLVTPVPVPAAQP